ncbi:MAG: 6-phosphogluconolactonase [Candidatus Kaiserbacteria bacterium]|nr:6-phosphogluconolactonase [Candidatus Kaiserbacteria bacterium]MCB9816062.1 6-phosphogluconolactonase [Candidatus Nomurabacteria bacterium]
MQLHTSDNPAKELGQAISTAINEHDGDVVCLLSGGSALDVVEHINITRSPGRLPENRPVLADDISAAGASLQAVDQTSESNSNKPECRTIFMMGDERGSREPEINNTLQLLARHPNHPVSHMLLETIPEENESLEDFAARIEKTFLQKISQLQNPKIFMILGMGPDGHTAGIFPLPEEVFQEIYRPDSTYVPVHVEGLTIDSRASLTPSWILDHVDQVLGFIVGESKAEMLESLVTESKKLHERPAELLKLHKDAHIYTDLYIDSK